VGLDNSGKSTFCIEKLPTFALANQEAHPSVLQALFDLLTQRTPPDGRGKTGYSLFSRRAAENKKPPLREDKKASGACETYTLLILTTKQ
jgi:hypothetical protein